MAVIIFFLLFSSSIFLNTEAVDKNCSLAKCFPNGPEILFPFSIKGLQPQNCSYPGFKLLCKENKTTIHFPSYGDLVVKSISYDSKRLSLLDPENCVHQVFLNLDLSRTPFHYYYILKNYTYLNCSAPLPRPFVQVPCMSGSEYHVYVAASFGVVPDSCKPVKTVAIPFSYSPYLADDSFGLGITWDVTRRREDFVTCFGAASGKVLSILVFIFMVATLVSVKTYCSRSAWFEKLCGYYATLKHAKFSPREVRNQVKTSVGYGNHGSESRSMLPNLPGKTASMEKLLLVSNFSSQKTERKFHSCSGYSAIFAGSSSPVQSHIYIQ